MAQGSSPEEDRRLSGIAEKLAGRLTRTGAMKLQLDNGPRSSLGIGQGLDDVVGPRWEFARRFAEGIENLIRSTLGDHRKKTG
ncbi:hypothetical protein BHM03_00044765 [Ensete ventricosum]|nr:hypothetical protein BHM03_00044765 [Ensete ventricosum]